jgi:beta-glucosidase
MKSFLFLVVSVATAVGLTSTGAPLRPPQSLFNGRDLSGWHVDVPAPDSNVRVRNPFIVRNGMLVTLGEPRGHLITDASYRDYRLEAEYRFPAAPGNAGILVHASTPRALYGMFPRSIEVQMEHGNAGDFWCILEDIRVPDMERRRGPPAEWGTTEGKARRILNLTDSSEKPLGQWNTMVIEAVGRSIRVWVNGDLVNDGSDATADHGQIAIQSEGSEVEFRKLVLTPITRLTAAPSGPVVVSRSGKMIEVKGLRFRDLNGNGVLDPYEDWRRSPADRAKDLVGRMMLEEKAGMMMHGTARSAGPGGGIGFGTGYDTAAIGKLIRDVGVNSFITRLSGDPRVLAAGDNKLQEIAEKTRLGIPLTISSDPRNHFQYTIGTSSQTGRFSQWPETLGFAATRDAALVRRFADIARREYRAVGIEETLSPQADLATEPRWSRISGTFGEDVDLSRALVKAYVEGFQHGPSGVDSAGVVAVVKHWVGYGAQKKGLDSHSNYGQLADFSSGSLDLHVQPFLGAFAAHVAGVMPTYSILDGAGAKVNGRPLEQVGAGYNRQLLTDLLRKRYGFDGVILTDWGITNDCPEICRNGFPAGQPPTFAGVGMPWGVENMSKVDRFAKAVNAGVDQFGGTEEAQYLIQGVRSGKITESRLNESVYRIAVLKFRQGLFENPYVDTAAAARVVGNAQFQNEATAAQRRSLVLLENKNDILPLVARGKRVFLHGVDSATAVRYGFTVAPDLAHADIAIVRTNAPFQTLHPNYAFGARFHEGDLGFRAGDKELEEIKRITAAVPTIVTVYLDRPAILTELKDRASALVGNFGISDAALLDVLTGVAQPEGRLPFELPSSMQEVEAQKSSVPHDTAHPLYRIGFGRRYSTKK